MKKFLTLVLALVMLASMFTFPAMAEEVPTLTMLIGGDNSPAEENEIVHELEKRLGIDLKITLLPSGDLNTKVNTMLAAGEEPDIYDPDASTLVELLEAGRIMNLEPYLAEYGKDILSSLGDDLHEAPANKDGYYAVFKKSNGILKNFVFRKDWLAKVGMEVPATTEELYEVLKAFAFNDPDGNGVNDTYGVAPSIEGFGTFECLFTTFGIPIASVNNFTGNSVLLEDGTVTTALKHPNFLEAITFLNKLYKEGIMDPDFATITQMQAFERLWNSKVGCISFQAQGVTNNWYPGRYTWEVPADPGEQFTFAHVNGNGSRKTYDSVTDPELVVSANCKYPEAAVALINYMYFNPEGQELTLMGIEGKHYEWIDEANGKYQRLGEYTDDVVHRATGAYCYNWAGGFNRNNAADRLYNKTTQDAQNLEATMALDWPRISGVLETELEYGADLGAIVKEAIANLIVTDGDIEAELAEYIARWENEGGLDVEEEATAAYAAEQAK